MFSKSYPLRTSTLSLPKDTVILLLRTFSQYQTNLVFGYVADTFMTAIFSYSVSLLKWARFNILVLTPPIRLDRSYRADRIGLRADVECPITCGWAATAFPRRTGIIRHSYSSKSPRWSPLSSAFSPLATSATSSTPSFLVVWISQAVQDKYLRKRTWSNTDR